MKFLLLLLLMFVTTFTFSQEDEEETISEIHITIELETGKKVIIQDGDELRWEGNSGYTNIFHIQASTKKETKYTGADIKEIIIEEDTVIKKYHPYKGEGFMKVILETLYQTESTQLLTSPIGFFFISLNGNKPTAFNPQADQLTRYLVCLPVKKKYSKFKGNFNIEKMIEILDYYEETCGKK